MYTNRSIYAASLLISIAGLSLSSIFDLPSEIFTWSGIIGSVSATLFIKSEITIRNQIIINRQNNLDRENEERLQQQEIQINQVQEEESIGETASDFSENEIMQDENYQQDSPQTLSRINSVENLNNTAQNQETYL